ncbi:MAG: alpha/beta hydrolase [Anaerolineae bacterium]|nr:alpha/beta hydrolase [Anaerolineae bacterium]MDQ7035227.1 alpha/beta hydrolase [Anaerolineae bacterium]
MTFNPHYLGTPEATLVYYTYGNADNPPLLLINGGPGDDHQYLRSVAEHYADSFYCILYDQRGCGKSTASSYNQTVINIVHFMADIDRIRRYLRVERLALWGHSWGAMLALYYGAFYPDKVQSMVLVGMGPLSEAARQVAKTNLLKPLSAIERQAYADLRAQRQQAFAAEDWKHHAQLHIVQLTQYNVRAWFYSPQNATRFAEDFAANYNYNPQVAPLLLPTVRHIDIFSKLQDKHFPLQIVYGYQDFEPITQAYQVQAVLPSAELCFINQAGHIPWYEQPDTFYAQTNAFLKHHIAKIEPEVAELEPEEVEESS